jgi:hypothetical protein
MSIAEQVGLFLRFRYRPRATTVEENSHVDEERTAKDRAFVRTIWLRLVIFRPGSFASLTSILSSLPIGIDVASFM